jgi:hypothetical protein
MTRGRIDRVSVTPCAHARFDYPQSIRDDAATGAGAPDMVDGAAIKGQRRYIPVFLAARRGRLGPRHLDDTASRSAHEKLR